MSKSSAKAAELIELARGKFIHIVTAESCTGGLLSAAITDIAGSSDVFERGFITYSNQSKSEMLGVPEDLIKENGAVSEEVAIAMAEGALNISKSGLSAAITGIAGPGGDSADKPVGLIYIASSLAGEGTICEKYTFKGDRASIRKQAVETAIEMLIDQLVD